MSDPASLITSSGPFSHASETDWAISWIDYLFHRSASQDADSYTARFSPIAEGIRHALGLYSTSMLILAGLLLFYHLATMIAETAQTGVAFGRRTNQLWAPLRLILAIALLVPVGSGLSIGQYLVIQMAQAGSTLASKAWHTIAESVDDSFVTLITPHEPNFTNLAVTATEMELCRLIYQKFYEPVQNDPTLHLIGDMGDAIKTPLNRFSNETWRYSNSLGNTTPLCGEYRFAGARRYDPFGTGPVPTNMIDRMSNEGASFAHTETGNLVTQAQAIAIRAMPTFSGNTATFSTDIHTDLATVISTTRSDLEARWHSLSALNAQIANQALAQSTEAGWIAAATFIPDLVRLQESTSEIAAHLFPIVQGPVLAHPALAQQALMESINTALPYPTLSAAELGKLQGFYAQVSRTVAQAHDWIYSNQLAGTDMMPISSFDLRDQVNAGTDPEAAASLFARALDNKATAEGLWGVDTTQLDPGYPFSAPTTDHHNPLSMLAEFGWRQYVVGNYLFNLAGSTIANAGTAAPAALTGCVGLALLGGGLGLIFLIPFLPFARFLFGVLIWLLQLFEAVVAMPIVAIAHLTPHGDGLSGGTARQAYILWIGLLIRPLLTLLGLAAGLVLFDMGLTFLNVAMIPFARLSSPTNEGLLIVANVGVIVIYDVLVYAIANAAFKGIYLLPDYATRWVSHFVITDASASAPAPTTSSGGNMTTASVFSAMAKALNYQGMSNNSSTKTNAEASTAAKDRGMKTALFPAYRETTVENGLSNSSSTADRSTSSTSSITNAGTAIPQNGNGKTTATTNKEAKPSPSPFTNTPFFPDKK